MALLNRKPNLELPGEPGKPPYLRRWWFCRTKLFSAYLHRFGSSDDARAVHDHPAANLSIVLAGRYREHFHDGTYKDRGPGSIVFRQARLLHRLELLTPTVTTLFFFGPRTRKWGFQTADEGWIPHEEWEAYCNARRPTTAELRAWTDKMAAHQGDAIRFRRPAPPYMHTMEAPAEPVIGWNNGLLVNGQKIEAPLEASESPQERD